MRPARSLPPPLRLTLVALMGAMLSLAGCSSGPTSASPAGGFSFGVWGDMPYAKARDLPRIPALLASLNASDIAFSLYDGDIKDGSSRCTDAVFTEALAMFNQLHQPAVYVPGDNEWTDCHRLNNGGYDPLERLATLRQVMFAHADSLGQTRMPLSHQGATVPGGPAYVENIRFEHRGIVFATFNMPGSNNNLVLNDAECTDRSARTRARCDAGNAEYAARDEANRRWLHEAFERAGSQKAPGLVLVFQADPGFDLPETEADESQLPWYSGYRRFMAELADLTEHYPGQVLLVHGDTHFFKLDMPLVRHNGQDAGRVLSNFTRLETFGSPHIHWVKVRVDTTSPRVFSVEPVLVEQPR